MGRPSKFEPAFKAKVAVEALQEKEPLAVLAKKYGVAPEIVNTDQGRQYTTAEWENLLKSNHILISMDGRGRCKDNIWIERFWRSTKQEYIYLFPTNNVKELREGIQKWINFYNYRRPHQGLGGCIPSYIYELAA